MMNTPKCSEDCDRHYCPFEIDPYDPDRRVCIKCGKDYSFRRDAFPPWLTGVTLTIFVVALLESALTPMPPQRLPYRDPSMLPRNIQSDRPRLTVLYG